MVSAYYRIHCCLEIALLLVAVCEFQYGSRFSDRITISFTYGIHNYRMQSIMNILNKNILPLRLFSLKCGLILLHEDDDKRDNSCYYML